MKTAVAHNRAGYWVLQAVLTLSRTAVNAGLKDSRLYASSTMTGLSLASAQDVAKTVLDA